MEGSDETWPPGETSRLGRPGRPPEKYRTGTRRRADAGVAGNARLTAANAAVLLVLLAAEGVTILRVHQLLSPHVFIGVVLISGVGLLLVSGHWLPLLLKVHKASFVLWFGAMTIHVLGHLGEVFRLAPRDWLRRTRREVTGAGTRQWLIAASLVAGVLLGFLLLSHVGHWLSAVPGAGH